MAEFPGQGYPPHIPPQHAPRLQQRRRKQKPPASLSKLHRPLRKIINKNTNPKTRFYCNDCKKKFRSRILANRNNNAVQHYCSLYSKIITRKVDSHSNKCKGDHGMGPCVVKRTDNDPDSDGEDETKAAYYADKGKKRPSTRKSSGAYTKKRKRNENDDDSKGNDNTPQSAKRQRRNHDHNGVDNDTTNNLPPPMTPPANNNNNNNMVETGVYYPPVPSGYNGYYNDNGHGYVASQYGYNNYGYNNQYPGMHNGNGYHRNYSPQPPMPLPPPMDHQSSTGSAPPMPLVADEVSMMAGRDRIGSRIGNDGSAPPPPPPLEEIAPMVEENDNVEIKNEGMEKELLFVEVNDNTAGSMINTDTNGNENVITHTRNGGVSNDIDDDHKEVVNEEKDKEENDKSGVEKQDDDEGECINDENTEEDDDLPDLTVPCHSPIPNKTILEKDNDNGNADDNNQQQEDQDADLILELPQ